MKKVLIIGSGWEQYKLIKEAKKMGLEVIATHPVMNNEGFLLSDYNYIRNAEDIESHINLAKSFNVDGIITDNCDYSFYTATVVSSILDLPFATMRDGILCIDKHAQRELVNKKNNPTYFECRDFKSYLEAIDKLTCPYIVKPVDNRGTFGVMIVKNKYGQQSKYKSAFYNALSNSPSKRVIVEQFIEGTLVTVDGFCFKNGHRALAVASRKYNEGPIPVTNEIIYPAEFSNKLNKKLLDNHENIVKDLGYQYGHTHGEYIVDKNEKIYLVECTNRGGGVYTSSTIVPLLTEINLNKILIEQSLGIDKYTVSNDDFLTKNSAILSFLNLEPGKVIKSINLEELKLLSYVVELRSLYNEKDLVESIENCASRHIMLVIKGDNLQESKNNLEDFKNKLKVEYYK
jgi:biotin carboxylase